jgi:hypothetical protein
VSHGLDIFRIVSGIPECKEKFLDGRVDAAVELHHRVVGPKLLLNFFESRYGASVLDEHSQNLERLVLEHNQLAGFVQFSRLQIKFEGVESNAKWQCVLHRARTVVGEVYTATPLVPSGVCGL